jgi:hypothetical protein
MGIRDSPFINTLNMFPSIRPITEKINTSSDENDKGLNQFMFYIKYVLYSSILKFYLYIRIRILYLLN